MKKILSVFLMALLLFCFTSCSAKQTEVVPQPVYSKTDADERSDLAGLSTPLLWEVTGNGFTGKFYLFGSIHVGLEDTNKYPSVLTAAFNSCDSIAVETDVIAIEEDPATAANAILPFLYTDGTTIKDHISNNSYERCVDLLKKYGVYNTYMDQYNGSLWYLLIDQSIQEESTYKSEYGVDRFFLKSAKEMGKTVLEIEDYRETYCALAGLSDRTQDLILQDISDPEYLELYDVSLKSVYEAWKCGDVQKAVEVIITNDTEIDLSAEDKACADEYNRVLVENRNKLMTNQALNYLHDNRRVFFVVGLAHMLNTDGLVQTLADNGYTVTPITY